MTLKSFVPATIWGLVILGLSVMPGVNLPESLQDLWSPDKLAHAFVYFILTLLLIRGFHANGQLNRTTLIGAILISSAYGILLESVQYVFFPKRYFEILDIIANIIGSIGSLLVFKYFLK